MKNLKHILGIILLFGTLSCVPKEDNNTYQPKPAMRLTLKEITNLQASFTIEKIHATEVFYLCCKTSETAPDEKRLIAEGTVTEANEVDVLGLEMQSEYAIYALARNEKQECSSIVSVKFETSEGPGQLYWWEKGRNNKSIKYSNLALCYGGSTHRRPRDIWDKDRFDKHVTYIDENGAEHWLFDAFLAIEFIDEVNHMAYMLGMDRTTNNYSSADKNSWTSLMNYWFADDTGFGALNKSVGAAIERIGRPETTRKVIITMPDPLIYQHWYDDRSSTTYWGSIDGKKMDFSKAADRLQALQWYIDEVRERWNKANYDNLEFIGFYIITEEISIPGYGWNPELVRWEEVFPAISRYIHACNETLSWIPYNSAPGYQFWQSKFEIDFAMMQPNYFWDTEGSKNLNTYMNMVMDNGLSMEFEFDDAILESKGDSAVPFRTRFYKYMDMCHDMDLYGKRELSYYFGGDTFYNIATSKYPLDQKLYHDLSKFIIPRFK